MLAAVEPCPGSMRSNLKPGECMQQWIYYRSRLAQEPSGDCAASHPKHLVLSLYSALQDLKLRIVTLC